MLSQCNLIQKILLYIVCYFSSLLCHIYKNMAERTNILGITYQHPLYQRFVFVSGIFDCSIRTSSWDSPYFRMTRTNRNLWGKLNQFWLRSIRRGFRQNLFQRGIEDSSTRGVTVSSVSPHWQDGLSTARTLNDQQSSIPKVLNYNGDLQI